MAEKRANFIIVLLLLSNRVTPQMLVRPTMTSEWCGGLNNCNQHSRTSSCSCDPVTCRRYDNCCRVLPPIVDNTTSLTPSASQEHSTVSCVMARNSYFQITKDVRSFFMVTGCPSGSDVTTSDLCSRHSNNELPPTFYQLPVYGGLSKILYGNYYCAVCNGENDVIYWGGVRECDHVQYVPSNETRTAVITADGKQAPLTLEPVFESCRLLFRPRTIDKLSPCADYDSCPPAWTDRTVEDQCRATGGTHFVYRHETVYRNVHCAVCNGIPHDQLACEPYELPPALGPPMMPTLSILIDFNKNQHSTSYDVWVERDPFECPDDNEFWDPFKSSCVKGFCRPGMEPTESGQCVDTSRKVAFDYPMKYKSSDNVTKAELFNCSNMMLQYNVSEITRYDNGSMRLNNKMLFGPNEYLIEESVVYVCSWYSHPVLNDAVQSTITLVGVMISLVLLLALIIVYLAFPVLLNTPGKCLLSLVTSLFAAEILFVFVFNDNRVSHSFCVGQSVLMHYVWLAAFQWMNVMSYDIHRTFASTSSTPSSTVSAIASHVAMKTDCCRCPPGRFARYSIYAWTLPAVVVGAALSFDLLDLDYSPGYASRDMEGSEVCWFANSGGLLVFFAAPVGLLLAINIILFVSSSIHIYKASAASRLAVHHSNHIQQLVLYVKLFVLMGLTWSLGFLATMTQSIIVWYLFTVFNSLQGALIALSFLSARQVRRLISKAVCPSSVTGSSSPGTSSTTTPSTKMMPSSV